MDQTSIFKILLLLVRLGIGHSAEAIIQPISWKEIEAIADRQGLFAIVLDGIEKLPSSVRPPQDFLLEWIGEVLQGYEYRYEQYCRAISELAGFYNSHGYKMMILKGYACCLDWPRPEHRPLGDIDIWLFGKQKEADAELAKGKGIEIDSSHHHHTVFNVGDFTVENHYDFINVYAHRSSAKLEKVFKKLGQDDTHFVELYGERVYLPSPNLHALFLIKHMVSHFAAAEINLRQVLDWAFFVEKHHNEVDWEWLDGMLEEYHMRDFTHCLNAICVEDLGFEANRFKGLQFNRQLKDRILDDILEPEYGLGGPMVFFQGLVYKYKRWQGNAWKQKLCYNETRWESFWTGIWAKILKPASIKIR